MVGPTLTVPAPCGLDPGSSALISGWRSVASPIVSPTRVVLSTSRCFGTCQAACRCTNPVTSWSNCWYGLTLEVGDGDGAAVAVGVLGAVVCTELGDGVGSAELGGGVEGAGLEELPLEELLLEELLLEELQEARTETSATAIRQTSIKLLHGAACDFLLGFSEPILANHRPPCSLCRELERGRAS
jgi:hypothetical protein